MLSSPNTILVTCPKACSSYLRDELEELGFPVTREAPAGVFTKGNMEDCMRLNLLLRTGLRVLWRVAEFEANNGDQLYKRSVRLPWESWIPADGYVSIGSSIRNHTIRNTNFAGLRLKDALVDRIREKRGRRPDTGNDSDRAMIFLYWHEEEVCIYLDTSGVPISNRGYRVRPGKAPMRENLAASVLRATRWDMASPLVNPMCGSGTFLIEASMMALNQMPGLRRNFGFENWKNLDSKLLKQIKSSYESEKKPLTFSRIYGSDKDLRAIRVAKRNLVEAGLEEAVQLVCKKITEISPPFNAGVMITNPPYGIRIGEDEELAEAYPLWASCLKNKFSGWRTYFLTSDFRLPKLMRLSPSKKTPLYNGALDCRLFEIKMVAGSNRKK